MATILDLETTTLGDYFRSLADFSDQVDTLVALTDEVLAYAEMGSEAPKGLLEDCCNSVHAVHGALDELPEAIRRDAASYLELVYGSLVEQVVEVVAAGSAGRGNRRARRATMKTGRKA